MREILSEPVAYLVLVPMATALLWVLWRVTLELLEW